MAKVKVFANFGKGMAAEIEEDENFMKLCLLNKRNVISEIECDAFLLEDFCMAYLNQRGYNTQIL